MTNREVLNKLSNVKLAAILSHVDCGICMLNDEAEPTCPPNKKCTEGIRMWLEAEAKPLMTGMLEEESK